MLDEADGTPLNIDTNADLAHERRTARGEPNGNQSGEADSDGATAQRSPHWTQPSQLSRLERFDSVTCGVQPHALSCRDACEFTCSWTNPLRNEPLSRKVVT